MITYEPEKSPFFTANKVYCEAVDKRFKELSIECTGWCNSFGYELEASFSRNEFQYKISLQKYQTTQNGVVIPVPAHDSEECKISVTGMDKKFKLHFGRNKFKRFFTSFSIKKIIPSPHFLFCSFSIDKDFAGSLFNLFSENNISTFSLSGGSLRIRIYETAMDPMAVVLSLEKILLKQS